MRTGSPLEFIPDVIGDGDERKRKNGSDEMTEAVIVSTARTPIGKAFRGAFNMTHGATLGGHVVKHAVARAGIDPAQVDDVMLGCATPE